MSSGQQPEAAVPEVTTAEVTAHPKQYLVMVDEMAMTFLGKLVPSMLFVQVEGMAMKDNSDHMLLVNPIAKQAPITAPVEGVRADA